MLLGQDDPAMGEGRGSLAARARWILKLTLAAMRRRDDNFLLLSPPFHRQQKVLDRRAGVTRTFSIRGDDDYGALARVFGDEAYRLDRLARGGDLIAAYHRILAARATPLILDCGIDSGLSTRYFADAFPFSRVIGVEPDPESFLRARANCAVDNIELRQAAIASECRRGASDDSPTDERPLRHGQGDDGIDLLSINSLVAEQC